MIEKGSTPNDSISRRFQLEEICTKFERDWRKGQRQAIEDVLTKLDEQIRPNAVCELVAVELELRFEAGENPLPDEYSQRLPDYSTEILQGFELWQLEKQAAELSGLEVPERIGDYKIIRKLGQGGMGVVYEAIQESLDRRVAIKSLGTHPIYAPQSARRFRREARAVAMLHHTNIINVYGSGVHNGVPYFAMQLVDGRSLSQIIKDVNRNNSESSNRSRDALSIEIVAKIGVQIASALEYAHGQGILHRDIKPSNLLLDEFGTAWVSDFGLAKLKDHGDATFSGDVVGTLRYVPPEATHGHWTELGDVYSLGITLYELLALSPAYPESDHIKLLDRIARGDPPINLRRIDGTIPKDLETIILKTISRDPASRYQSAAELGKELQRYVDGEPIFARPTSSTEWVMKWSKRNPVVASLMAMICLIVTGGLLALTALWWRSQTALESVAAEKTKTEIAKIDAVVARKVSKIARDDSVASEYGSSMQLAQKFLEDGITAEVDQLFAKWQASSRSDMLAEQRELLKGWEWNYLNDRLDSSHLTLRANLDYVWDVAIRKDDSVIATVHGSDPVAEALIGGSEVVLWDAATGTKMFSLATADDRIYSVAFSPNGRHLATLGMDLDSKNGIRGKLKIWAGDSGELIENVDLPGRFNPLHLTLQHKGILPKVSYSPDGTRILTSPNPVEIWDAFSLQSIADFSGKEAVFLSENRVVLLQFNGDLVVKDVASGNSVSQAKTGHVSAFDLGVTNDGKCFIFFNDRLRIYANEKLRDFEDVPLSAVHYGNIDDAGQYRLIGGRGGKLLVQSNKGDAEPPVILTGHRSAITKSAVSHSGQWLVTSSLDGTAKVWELDDQNREIVQPTGLLHDTIADIAFSIDGDKVLFAGRGRLREKANAGWFVADRTSFDSNQLASGYVDTTYAANWPRTDFAFSPCGKFILAPTAEKKVRADQVIRGFAQSGSVGIWGSDDWQPWAIKKVELDEISSVCWSSDGEKIVIAGQNMGSKIRVFDLDFTRRDDFSKVKISLTQTIGLNDSTVTAMAFGKRRLAIAIPDKIYVFELSTADNMFKPRQQFTETGTGRFMDFSPDESSLAVAIKETNQLRVYDVIGKELKIERPAPKNVCCVRYSPNGKRIAMSGNGILVYLCDSETGHRLLNLSGTSEPVGSLSSNSRVVFSSDGRKIATNNWRGQISVWEADTEPPTNRR